MLIEIDMYVGKNYLLFGIVCWVGKKPGEKVPFNAIREQDDDPIFVHIQKVVVEEDMPDTLHELPSKVP